MAQNIFDQVAQEEATKVASSNQPTQSTQPSTQPVVSPKSPATPTPTPNAPATSGNIFDQVAQEEVTKQSQQQQQQQTQTNAVPTDDYLAKTENAIHHGAEFVGDVYNEVGQMAEGFKNLGDQIFGYKASDNVKNLMTKGWHSLVDGNGNEARADIRDAVNDYVVNHPLSQMAQQQWDSSMANRQKAIEAGKKGHVMDTAQHVAGVLPMVNVASDAIDKAKAEPSIQNYAHASVALAAAMTAYYGMIRGAVPSAATVPEETIPETLAQRQAAMDARAANAQAADIQAADIQAADAQAADAQAATVTPVEQAVTKAVSKSRLPEGSLETTVPTGEDIQPNLQRGIHDIAKSAGGDAGIEVKSPTSVRDAFKTQADAVLERSKAAYKELDSASGGQWQRFDNSLKNINRQIQEKVGIDDDAVEILEQKRNEIETSQAQLIEDLKAEGKVKPELADAAIADYKKAMALRDVDNAVKMSTKGRAGVGRGVEEVEANKLNPRLQKLYDKGRLQQAVGEDAASQLIGHAEDAQTAAQAVKDFVPSSATGQKALAELLRSNTGTGVKGAVKQALGMNPQVDMIGAFKDFNALSPEDQAARFGSDLADTRVFLKNQARWQMVKMLGTGITLEEIARRTGISKFLLHLLID